MNIMTKRGNQDNMVTYEHMCDRKSDMANIDKEYITLGSIAIVLQGDDGLEVYMANSDKEWQPLILGGSAGGGGEAAGSGFTIHVCTNAEIDNNGFPNIAAPDPATIYFVPNDGNVAGNIYKEYVYVNSAWEKFGDSIAGAVKYSETQTLTAAQQAQARANIGAGDAEDVAELKSAFDSIDDTVEIINLWDAVSTSGATLASGYQINSAHSIASKNNYSVLYIQVTEAGTYNLVPSTATYFSAYVYQNISSQSDITSSNYVKPMQFNDMTTRECEDTLEANQWIVCSAYGTSYTIDLKKKAGKTSDIADNVSLTIKMNQEITDILQNGWQQFSPTLFEGGSYQSYNSKTSGTKYRVRSKDKIWFPYDVTLLVDDGFYLTGYLSSSGVNVKPIIYLPKNTPIALVIRRIMENSSETADVETFVSKVHISSALCNMELKKETYTDISMFERVGVCGDSYAAGGGIISGVTALTWGKNLERQAGVSVSIFARSGQSVVGWMTDSDRGLPALLAADECGLYWMQHGINGTSTQEAMGTPADMSANPRPQTFYGQYVEAIKQVQAAYPDARIVVATITGSSYSLAQTTYADVNQAISDIAEYCEVPLIDITKDDFYKSLWYQNWIRSSHPVAMQCPGMAAANRRLIAKCIMDNPSYFLNYGNRYDPVE